MKADQREYHCQARKKLQESDIASRRGAGGTGGTALTRGIAAGIGDYGKTVGDAHARAVEEADYRNRQLAMQSRMQAGQLGLGATQQSHGHGCGHRAGGEQGHPPASHPPPPLLSPKVGILVNVGWTTRWWEA